ncbi:hypothetical protein LBW78_01715 [Rothia kristinae]|nr:hypothetical protein [Rothia kristinae]
MTSSQSSASYHLPTRSASE